MDMALGGDQGGSIRMPAAACGIVGLKPTYGLVPYTGVMPMELSIDHTGPMAKTVYDTALMLEVWYLGSHYHMPLALLKLFDEITTNPQHRLHKLLPARNNCDYSLRNSRKFVRPLCKTVLSIYLLHV